QDRFGKVAAEGGVAGPHVEVNLHAVRGVVSERSGIGAGLAPEFRPVDEPRDVVGGPLKRVGKKLSAPSPCRSARVGVVRLRETVQRIGLQFTSAPNRL